MKYFRFLIFMTFISLLACSDVEPETTNTLQPTNPAVNGWLIPQNQVRDGGVGKDGIPSIDDPKFTLAIDVDYLVPEDLVLGIEVDGETKAYPHPILDWHEIINDRIGNKSIALTYCPLTGTGIGWGRVINDQETTFGVSGLLYNTNLMPYDRVSNSTWSQQRLDCVNGDNIGYRPELYTFIETTWSTWLAAYPDSKVVNTDTGYDRDYGIYPYNDYRSNNENLIFPISNTDRRLPAKDRVLGVVVSSDVKAYPFNTTSSSMELIEDEFKNKKLLIVRDTERNFIISFLKDDEEVSYTVLSKNEFPFILEDGNGIKYDILGNSDMNSNKKLKLADQFIGYWFSWGTFYPNLRLHEG